MFLITPGAFAAIAHQTACNAKWATIQTQTLSAKHVQATACSALVTCPVLYALKDTIATQLTSAPRAALTA